MLEDALRDIAAFIKWMVFLVPLLGGLVVVLSALLISKW